jgi:DNA-binding transcriptional regulator YiaG
MRYDAFKEILDDNLRKRAELCRKYDWTPANVRALRRHIGLNQDELARVLQVRRVTISGWENGYTYPRRPNQMALMRIAEYYGFTPIETPRQQRDYQAIPAGAS